MKYETTKVDFLLNKITSIDKLFNGKYTVDPYQNCEYGCLYCDSGFDKTIKIKTNASEILDKELKKLKKGTIIVGSVHDPYQKAEERYKITRDIIKVINKHDFPCHILTKSDMILRDIDILLKIKKLRVTLSLISLKKKVNKYLEKNIPSPNKRLNTIKKLTKRGINAGLAIIPIIPFITDNEIEEIIKIAKNYDAKYILYKPLELKGDQKQYFFNFINKSYPKLLKKYEILYKDSYKPIDKYINYIDKKYKKLSYSYQYENRNEV